MALAVGFFFVVGLQMGYRLAKGKAPLPSREEVARAVRKAPEEKAEEKPKPYVTPRVRP